MKNRSKKRELLDEGNIPFEDIVQNLKELDFINSYLGGHKITYSGIENLLNNNKNNIVEIGCGGGDNLAYIHKKLVSKKIDFSLQGIDIKKTCVDYANSKNNIAKYIYEDYKDVEFDTKPTIIFSSLFCHHFNEQEIIEQLKWMQKNAVNGFFINDLQRNSIAYFLIKILSMLFSKSYLVKHDAPLSVARAYTKKEWRKMLELAEIKSFSIQWKWAFRYLIVVKNDR